jgi:site-specific recombinase XerD
MIQVHQKQKKSFLLDNNYAKKTMKDYVEEYLEKRCCDRLSRSHFNTRKVGLTKYMLYLDYLGKEVWEIGIREAEEYAGWLKEKRLMNNTVLSYVSTASVFHGWLKKNRVTGINPFCETRFGKRGKQIPKNLPKPRQTDELLILLGRFNEEANLSRAKGRYRAHVLAELLYSTGMRISEAAGLKVEDVDLESAVVRIVDVKTKKLRTCFLNEYAAGVMELYINRLRKLIVRQNSRYLFGSSDGARLGFILSRELAPLCTRLGLPHLTSHCFRHSVGYHMLKAGCDIRFIQEILGHEKLSSTQIYTKVDCEDLLEVIDTYHPRTFGEKEQ